VIAVTQPASLRAELLPPIPSIAVTQPVSLRAELLPPIPSIAVTQPVSLQTELLPQSVQSQVRFGRRYGLQNRDSRITLRVHRPTIVAIRDTRNRIFIDRKLAPGDTYRVPDLVGLWLTAIDAGAVEIILDGGSVGFAGVQGVVVRDLSLNPQSIADRARDVPDP
jgi:cytoskeleton protein RodZ